MSLGARGRSGMRSVKSILKLGIKRLGVEIVPLGGLPASLFHTVLSASALRASEEGRAYWLIQVGANDGITNDPLNWFIRRHCPKGVLVEPQPDVFRELVDNYRHQDGLRFANVALSPRDDEVSLFRISPSFYEHFARMYKRRANPSGVTSLNKDHVREFLLTNTGSFFAHNDVDEYIECDTVAACALSTLLHSFSVPYIDLLQVDTEGYDHEVVKMAVEGEAVPQIINYEHKNMSPEDQRACTKLLLGHGFSVFRHGGDTCAFQALLLNKGVG